MTAKRRIAGTKKDGQGMTKDGCISYKHCIKCKYSHWKTYFVGKGTCLK